MKIEKIVMVVKRTQVMEVVVSEQNGFDMPTTGNQLLDICREMKELPERYYGSNYWEDEEKEIVTFDIEEPA